MKPKTRILFILSALALCLSLVGFIPYQQDLLPTIVTDKPDYMPGEWVTITGTNFPPRESVDIFVNDDIGQTWSHHSIDDPVTGDTGEFTYKFQLPTWFVANYSASALSTSGSWATTTFTDLNVGTYDQCSNDDGDGYGGDPGTCAWVTGNLQRNNSVYMEGDATVQRLWLTDFVPGSTHTVTLKYGTTKGGKHAYDFLTTWNWSEDWVELGDLCSGMNSGCTTAAQMTYPIPDDPNVTNTIEPIGGDGRLFTMGGGTITAVSTPAIVSGSYTADSETAITLTYTVGPSTGSMCSTKNDVTTCDVMLWFGAHVSVSGQWKLYNGTTGAGTITGSPYHVALDKVDGAAVGQRDNQMQADVITYIPNGTITVIKDAVPNSAQDFSYNLNNASTIDFNFALDDDPADATLLNTQSFEMPPGTWTLKELLPLADGWDFTSLNCTDPSGNTTVVGETATINLASLETVTCTYTNTQRGHIIVKKVTSGGDYSFEFDPSWSDTNFFLSNGQTNDSGLLVPGTYSVAEVNVPSTWQQTGATCDDGSPVTAVSLQAGETVTCTFNNTRVYNKDLVVEKSANAAFTRTYSWDISKAVDKTTASIADGGSAAFNYTVGVTHDSGTDSLWAVSGAIKVSNPNGFDITGINLTDAIDNGGTCTVTGGTDLTVPANDFISRNYSCTFDAPPAPGTNVATAAWDASAFNTPTGSASGSRTYTFTGVVPTVVNGSVNVTDTLGGNLGSVAYTETSPKEFTYSYTFSGVGSTCTKYDNTATITENGKFAKQTVEVCAGKDLTVTKTAAASKDRLYQWLIDKSVDKTTVNIAEGGFATFNYSVKVTPDGYTDSGYVLGGEITITNPNDWEDVTVSVADTLDQGGTCTITEAAPYVVPKAGSLTLHYTCDITGTPTQNTAAVTWDKAAYSTPNGEASASADVTFTLDDETNKTITVIDDKTDPLNPVTLGTSEYDTGPFEFGYSLDKQGTAGECTDYTNTAVISETGQKDDQKVTVCVGKDLTVTKTAAASKNRTYKWLIDKSVDDTRIEIAQGGLATFNYSVKVTPDGYTDSGFALNGTITIDNPNAWEDVTVSVADTLDQGGTCTITEAAPYVVPRSGSLTLHYTCASDGTSMRNTATVSWNKGTYFTPNASATAGADVTFTIGSEINKIITVIDDKTDPANPVTLGTSDYYAGPFEYTYALDKQGAAGKCTDYTNIAVIDETDQSDNQKVTVCVGRDLTVTKTADPTFTRTWDWTLTKDADATYNLFAGGSVTHGYKVTVTPTPTDSAWKLVGTITITNPNEWEAVTANLSDVVDNGGTCVVDQATVTVPAGSFVDVAYTCTWAAAPASYTGINTAAVTWDSTTVFTPNGSASGQRAFEFTHPTEINPVITVDDDNLTGETWSADRAYAEWTYTKDFSCSADPADYAGDGKYDFSLTNTAKINETTGDSDTAAVTVNCYAPVMSKTAAGTYNEVHNWDVTKTVNPVSQSAFAGDTVSYEWTVTVTENVSEAAFKVAGEITVVNPAPMEMTVDLADSLGGGTAAAVGTCTGGTFADGKLTIPANTTAVCGYEAAPTGRADTVNNVNATLNGIDYSASASFGWTANIIRGSAVLDDDQNPAFPLEISDGSTWKYAEQYTCSTDKTLYDAASHKYAFAENNTATLTSGSFTDSSSAATKVDCYLPTISKDASGTYREEHDWLVYKTGPGTIKKFAGQPAAWNWTVRVDETTHGEGYLVTGDIVVTNPNPEDALTVALNDVLDDGSIAAIGPCTGGTLVGNTLTVPANGTATCEYSVTPKGDLAAFAAALPAQVTENLAYPGPESYFMTTLTNAGALNGTYEGWCVDVDHTISPNRNYTANVFSSYETLPAGLVEHPENFDLVNWIINYDFVGKPAGTGLGNYTYGDVQEAIWELIEDTVPAGEISHNDTRVNQIKALAAAHEGYTPTCGDYVAVVLQPVDGSQPITIGQVTFASLGVSCADTNVVTAVFNGVSLESSADILWTATPVNPTATLDDTQNPAWPITVSADQTFTYADPQGYTCPTDPAAYAGDGIAPVYSDPNTATLTYEGGVKSASATATVYCYAPIVSKTAATEWRKKYDWTITKTADPASHSGFAGDSFTSAYDVFVDQTVTDYGFLASGTIDVRNPAGSPGNMTVNVADMLSGGIAAVVDCDPLTAGDQTSVVVAANTTRTCAYTASLPDTASRVNTATGTFNSIAFTATADVIFGAPIIEGYPTINVNDSVSGVLGSASEDKHFTYTRDFTCSTNAADYTNYADSDTYANTASITETGASDDASVTAACYIPEISKTAAGAYGERHEWAVEKTVTPASQDVFAGGTVGYEWKVVVTEEVFEENFVASGQITLVNHNPEDAMTVALSDVLSDNTAATITVCTGDADLTDGLTITAGGTSVCDYTAALTYAAVAAAPTNNTATAVLNNLSYTASDPVEWTPTITRANAVVTDDQIGLNQTISDGQTFTGSEQYTCSANPADYAGDGTVTFSESNTAIVTSDSAEEDRDSATETINCYGPVVSKTAAGAYDERHEWDVEKTVSPIDQSGFAGDTLPFTWTITVKEDVFEESFAVTGEITVVNPAPMAMTVDLADALDTGTIASITADADCAYADGKLTIPANSTATCPYTSAPDGRTAAQNNVTAALNTIAFTAFDPVEWTANVIRGEAELTDLQGPLNETITGSGTWTVVDSYTCSTDTTKYTTNYSYTEDILNTAKVTSEEEEQDSSTSTETITCYVPQISKTAAGAYGERHEWDVEKTVDPASQSAFAGDTVTYEWTVNVVESVFEENFVATGTITVVNHNPEDALTVALSDVLSDSTAATITACTGDANLSDGLTIAAGGTSVCDYTAALAYTKLADAPTNNTATAVLNGISYSASDPIEWAATVTRASVSLDDDQNPAFPLEISESGTWNYSEQYTCSTDKTAYDAATHKYTFGESNTAVVKDGQATLDSSTASNAVDCYVPTISKDANGRYDEVHDWEVYKTGTATQSKFAGQSASFSWTVRVNETTHGEGYVVNGKISVANPNPEDALVVALTDMLDDSTVAAIGPCTGGTWSSPNLTVPAGGTAVCDYTVAPTGDLTKFAAALPATVTINSINPGPESYWLTTITNDAALNGIYESWCVDIDHTMNPSTNYTAAVYSSYEAFPADLIEKPENMDLVNWIINQDFVGKPAGGTLGNYTYGDVQRAIWELIEDNPTSTLAGLGLWNQTRVNQIKAAAVTSGEGFAPTCGDFVAVLLVPTGGQQPIAVAQVTFASLGISCADNNVATAVLNGVEFPASAQILWTVNKINETAVLDDDQKPDWPVTLSEDQVFTYADPQGYTCSTNPSAYTNGYYQYSESNTAVLTYQTGSDTAAASTIVKCFAPIVSKTAAGAYDERHEWDVEKTVDKTTQNAFAGDTVGYEWTVTVTESVFEENFAAAGTISVKNPRTDAAMLVTLSDALNDGAAATITTCSAGSTWNETNKTLSIPGNSTAVCSYTAAPAGRTATLNTATVKLNGFTTTATANLAWTANVIRGSATLDDDQNPAFPLDISGSGTWTYDETYTCSTTRTDYGATDFWYKFGEDNTAIVTSGDERDRDSASTEVNCYWPQIDITKSGDELSKISDKVYYDISVFNNTPANLGLRALSCKISDPKIGYNETVELASGAKDENLDIEFTIPQTTEDPFKNTASVTCSPLASTFSVSDSAEWSTNLFQPKVEIIKTGPLYATSGDVVTYTFTINNLSSSDSPNLMLDSVSDNVLGDLKTAALAAGCDNLAYNGTCTFTATYTVPDVGLQAFKKTNTVTLHMHPKDFPNDISDTDDHTITIAPRSQLTDTSFCPLPDNQFRLLYHPDTAINVYRLQASNPGQFYFNGFYFGEPGSDFTMELNVPYPFVTQEGAGNPIQVHDGTELTSSGCFLPNPSLGGYTITTFVMEPASSAGNQIITPEDYIIKKLGETTMVTVSGKVPATGFVYVTIHLDYGLKKTTGWKNTTASVTVNPVNNTAYQDLTNQTTKLMIKGYQEYGFSRTVGDDTAPTTPASYNEIKKFAGFLGMVTEIGTGEPVGEAKVTIYKPDGSVLKTLYTDVDGYYMYAYKHTAKSATYTVTMPDYGLEVKMLVKANGFAAVDFEIPSSSSPSLSGVIER